ncbi:MAG TPA: Cys-Gln thioester bond-forming surface protein [Candidatus Scybalousia intestinigallinarum]|nr:Cys-Gln thioester bond-forming surface protein [Candidatus Scybalousia intestinigallinarum]
MKKIKNKIINGLMLLLIGISCVPTVNASTYNETFNDKSQWISGDYILKVKESTRKYQQMTVITRNSDGSFVYCIEPGTPVSDGAVYPGQDFDQSYVGQMTQEQWRRITLLAYYGYGYGNHTDIHWYTVTQYLIWQTVPHGYDIYFTDSLNGNRITKYTNEINELNRLVEEHNISPNITNDTIDMVIGDTVELTDSNNVLNKFEVVDTDNVSASISGNTLSITANDVGDGSVTISKRDKNYSHPAIIYYHPTSQDLMMRGAYDPIDVNLKIEIVGGKVSVKKVDMDTGLGIAQGDATLDGAVYGIYDLEGNRVGEVISKGGEYVTSDYLPSLGTFFLKEEKSSTGYELNETKYFFNITKDDLYPEVDVTEKVIERDLKIFKVYASDETGFLTGEPNVTFDIYLKSTGEKVTSITTDENGYATATLPYGTYTVRQVSSTEDHEMVEDFEIVVNEYSEDPIYKLLANAEITARLKVIKIDSETGNTIPVAGIKFKIFDVENNEYVCQVTDKEQCVFETNDEGILLTPLPLESGTYRLEEQDQKLDGYLWNEEALTFAIGDDSTLINDNVFGAIVEVEFENTQVKGKVEINKTGEELIIEDDSYHYEKIKLEGAEFELRANEDIIVGGKTYYKKGELVTILVTDKDGYASIDNLPLGKYTLKEIKSANNNVLDPNTYEFELVYEDQYTEVVYKTFTLDNKYPKGELEFTKTDLVTGDPLPDTKIEIFTENGVKVFEGRTDENGKIIITDLPVGKYFILESDAPDGYILNEEKMWFSITENGEIVKADMTNEKIVEVPNTLQEKDILIEIISATLLLSGIGIIIYAKKKSKNRK